MKIADVDVYDTPSFLGVVPELLSDGSINFHVHRIDGHKKPIRSLKLNICGENILIPPMKNGLYVTHVHKFSKDICEKKPKQLKIEKNFFQSVKDVRKVSDKMMNKLDFNRKLHSDFNYVLADDEEIMRIYETDKLEGEHVEIAERAKEATKVLMSGSFKADIFRYYMLYTRGGVWLDDKSILRKSVSDDTFGLDIYDGFLIYGSFIRGVEIAFLAARKGNPIIGKLLTASIENVENREYTDSWLKITGPHLAKEIISELPTTKKVLTFEDHHMLKLDVYLPFLYEGKNLLWSQNDLSYTFDPKIYGPGYYVNLWGRGRIYSDNNSNRGTGYRFDTNLIHGTGWCCIFIVTTVIIYVWLRNYNR